MEDLCSWLTLLNVPGVGPSRFRALVKRFGTPGEALSASLSDLVSVPRVDRKTAEAIRTYRDNGWLDRQRRAIEDDGVHVTSFLDPDYPERLTRIYDPAPVLFVKGALEPPDRYAMAVVGTRSPSTYGRLVTEKITAGLVEHGITVVSGMARGIDSVAHRESITRGGRTIAVLGCGVDVVYPPEHSKLCKSIAQHGAVLSEFPMGTKPDASNFPRRNRLISGLSLGVVVVEAGRRSGALLTAAYALDQNREVFAVPGNVGAAKSQGTNRLIKRHAAKLVEDAEDVLEELQGILGKQPELPLTVPAPEKLSPNERAVLDVLVGEPKHIDRISAETNLDPSTALSTLLMLELAGPVRQLSGKMFVRV